jgi:hypothetical protein
MEKKDYEVVNEEDGSITIWFDMDSDVGLDINDFTDQDLQGRLAEYLSSLPNAQTKDDHVEESETDEI